LSFQSENIDFMASFPIIRLQETDSTNRYLSQLCEEKEDTLKEFTTVTSIYQTAGKGQRGNSWESEKGKNLLFSLLLYPSFLKVKEQFILSQLISLAIKEELDTYTSDIYIKWPNDIYWKERKICGILIENTLQGHHIKYCICGVGLNINQETFISNAPNPVSLKQITNKDYSTELILKGILSRIKQYYNHLSESPQSSMAIEEKYFNSLFRRNGFHPYQDVNGIFMAELLRVEPDGRFVLRDESGCERNYLFKEVQYIL